MRIGLIGFGKTGQSVAAVILNTPEMTLEWVVRNSERLLHRSASEFLDISSEKPGLIYPRGEFRIEELLDRQPVDVIIDFSSEEGLEYYGGEAARRGIRIVSAISHYSASRQHRLRILSRETPVLWSPNITIGINFLILAAKTLGEIAPSADIEILEEHFKLKSEVSGTAKIISHALGKDNSEIKSIRAGGIIGAHEIIFGFPYQTVRLRHESISRDAFGNGAVFAAKKLMGMPPGLYKMEDLLLPYFAYANPLPTRDSRPFAWVSRGLRRWRRERPSIVPIDLTASRPAATIDPPPPLSQMSRTTQR
ncbi:MAG: dihydrodipicolinate reductase [Acidobacteria bacterium]|nr:dihydrodipicolinate reductase [Acidobacteriota bacterium]